MRGWSEEEARARLAKEGPNSLPERENGSVWKRILGIVKEPMFLLLVGAAGLYFVFGDIREALTLLSSVVLVITITVVQEGRTERALEALRDLSSPKARVERGGIVKSIDARDLVVGDFIHLAEGDRIPADALLREGTPLAIDESLLTGESTSVLRHPDPGQKSLGAPADGGNSSLFGGSLVVTGRGVAEVLATGARSEIGRIGSSLGAVESNRTPLQLEVDRVVRWMAVVGVLLSIALTLILGFSAGDWKQALLSGITLAIALLPEEFPVVLTVFLALGAWRIAKSRVLTRRVTAVETLGGVNVLCTDKTGTLTRNRMDVRRLVYADGEFEITPNVTELPEAVHGLVEMSILASPKDPFDPMEKAFLELGKRMLGGTEHLHPNWKPMREYPLTSELLAVTWGWRTEGAESDARTVVATKGAPEAVFDLCHMDAVAIESWRAKVDAMAKGGLRVLAVAQGVDVKDSLPERAHDFEFAIVGLVGMFDPLRDDVPASIALCHRAGIRVVMITGDHPVTATAIAKSAGIDATRVVSGSDIDSMDDAALTEALATTCVIARAAPTHKLRIVRSLQARGQVVGMTGDGVNDAPALKAANIGIAMGKRGTDVAREAAALVLVEDDFGSIVDAVRTGRRIYDNLKKAVGYIVAVHVPIAGVSLVPALLGYGTMLTPALVVFLELIIDPACSVVFEMEPEEKNVMDRPPRSAESHLFTMPRMLWSLLQGSVSLIAALIVLRWAHLGGYGEQAERTLAFTMLLAGNVALLLANHSLTEPLWRTFRRTNPAMPYFLGGAATLLVALTLVPPIRVLFGFGAVGFGVLAMAVAAATLPVLALDVFKRGSRATIR